MKHLFLLSLLLLLAPCSHVTGDDAKRIALDRLASLPNGPSMPRDEMERSLQVSQSGDACLVELRDNTRNLLWAVTVTSSGESEVSKMAIDG